MNGDHLKMSNVRGDSCLNSIAKTPRHHNTFRPSTSPNSPSTPSSTSRTPRTCALQIGLPVDAHRDAVPLKGGECQGSLCIRLYLPNQSHIGQSKLMSFSQS